MERIRVPKGKKYWVITNGGRMIRWYIETGDIASDKYFSEGNYFHTAKEAEAVARKIYAVFNGADVIEMPSDEDISKESDSSAHEMDIDDGETPNSGLYWRGWWDAVRWLKSKIVK